MKGLSLAVLALFASEGSQAFVPLHLQRHGIHSMRASTVELAAEVDSVSVPYDAAARLAYDEWCKTYDRPFDPVRYEVFKDNYSAITVMNVSTKKAARESGDANPTLLALNEFADFTVEEYEAMINGEAPPATTGDVLGKVVEAAQSQSAASNALQEAADALAEEEEELAARLGLSSVEELEAAIDAMDGIAEDGSMIDGDNLAREARVRSAYLEWCREYGKESDEARFEQFFTNFLEMEEYAKETGKEMSLNEYADCTETEYAALMEGEEAVKEAEIAIAALVDEAPVKPAISAKQAAQEEAKRKKEEAEAEAKKKREEAAKAKAMAEEARVEAIRAKAKAAQEAAEKRAKAAAEARQKFLEDKAKALAEKARLASLTVEERRKEIEAAKNARQSAQGKDLDKEREDVAAEAIKAAKAAEAAAAALVERQRRLSEEAAEILRAQAREWEVKQARLAPPPPPAPEPAPAPKPAPRSIFGSILGSSPKTVTPAPAPRKAAVPPPPPKAVTPAPAPRPSLSLSSFFGSAPQTPAAKVEAPIKPVAKAPVAKAPPTPAPRPSLSLDFFAQPKSPPAPKPAVAQVTAPKPAPKPVPVAKAPAPKPVPVAKAPAPKPAPVVKAAPPKAASKVSPRATMSLTSLFKAPENKAPVPAPKPELNLKPVPAIDTSDPVTDAFSSFFGGNKKSPKAEAKPAPAPVPPKKEEPSFSFFSPKPAPKVAPPPPPAIAPKPAASASFFGPKPAPKVAPVPAAPAPAPKPAFSLFGSKPAPKVEPVPPPAPAPAPKSFSFFGGSKPTPPKAPEVPVKAPPAAKVTASRPTLSLFGGPKGTTSVASKPAAPAVKAAPVKKPTPPKKAAPPKDNIPVLSRWKQNSDGSITGLVSNSPSFRNGTEITTSPVRSGAKAGTVVRTGSGSQYRLL